jgi:hypothetical protein
VVLLLNAQGCSETQQLLLAGEYPGISWEYSGIIVGIPLGIKADKPIVLNNIFVGM